MGDRTCRQDLIPVSESCLGLLAAISASAGPVDRRPNRPPTPPSFAYTYLQAWLACGIHDLCPYLFFRVTRLGLISVSSAVAVSLSEQLLRQKKRGYFYSVGKTRCCIIIKVWGSQGKLHIGMCKYTLQLKMLLHTQM